MTPGMSSLKATSPKSLKTLMVMASGRWVLLSGILFVVIAVSPLRSKIISSIPAFLKSAISADRPSGWR